MYCEVKPFFKKHQLVMRACAVLFLLLSPIWIPVAFLLKHTRSQIAFNLSFLVKGIKGEFVEGVWSSETLNRMEW